VLNWLNPFKWWQIFQQNRRWKVASRQFIHYYHQRDIAIAETIGKSMVDIATELGKRKLRLESYYNLMLCYRELEQLDLAIDYGDRVLDLQRSLSTNSEDPILLDRMCDLADLLQRKGQMEDAIKVYGEASTIRKRIDCSEGSKQAIEILESLAAIYVIQSNEDRAEKLFKEAQLYRRKLGLVADRKVDELESAIEQIKSFHRGEHLTDFEKWQSMNHEVIKLYKKGEISSAISIAKQTLKIAEEIFPRSNNDLASSLNNLALLYNAQGEWAEAEHFYDQALAIRRILFSNKPNEDLVCSMNNLADLYRDQGRWAEAEPLYAQALQICENLLGEEPNEYLASILNNLATLYRSQGKWAEAEPLYVRSLQICEILFAEQPNNYLAGSLNNLGTLYYSQGKWDEAEPLLIRAIQIRQDLFGDRPNNNLASSLGNLASVYESQGRLDKAKPLFTQALEIHQSLFSETGHPDLVLSLTSLASAYAQLKQPDLALNLFHKAIESENKWLTNIIVTMDAQQRIQDLGQREPRLECILSLSQQYFPNDPNFVMTAFNAVLSRKAQAVMIEATFSQVIRNQRNFTPDLQQLQACKQEIANLSYAIANQPELKDRFNTLLKQRRDLEKNLARSIPAIDLAQQVIDRQALIELLPTDAFLVEFVRYRPFDFIEQKWQPARYLAFIVRHDREGVTAIDCGLAKPLDTAIDKFRRAYADTKFNGESSNFSSAKRDRSSTASTATLEPAPAIVQPDLLALLLPHFPTTGICYLAPDSHLHILPFHLLKTADGKYLGDRYHLHYLTTARDLYRRKFPISVNQPIILADPDYNGGTIPTIATSPKTGMQSSHDINGAAFDRLEINRTLGDRVAARYDVSCYSDLEATVERLERLNAPRLLAIATHGFSLPAQQDFIEAVSNPDADEERVLRARHSEITQEFRDYWQARADAGNEWSQQLLVKIDNIGIYRSTDLLATPISDPMLRSGIALAGANIWRFQGTLDPKFGKGVAFAHDIAQWNLWGTELVLMITCVSGLGEVRNSEGVFGLRRALAIAGAKYVITSLWNIPTKASVLLMDKFFELYQSEAPPTPPEALTAAQFYVRNITLGELKQSEVGREIVAELQSDRVRALRLDESDDFQPLSHPHFWGAWICQG
jgi:tetratricopeptide (TPR) repeat protein